MWPVSANKIRPSFIRKAKGCEGSEIRLDKPAFGKHLGVLFLGDPPKKKKKNEDVPFGFRFRTNKRWSVLGKNKHPSTFDYVGPGHAVSRGSFFAACAFVLSASCSSPKPVAPSVTRPSCFVVSTTWKNGLPTHRGS